MKGISGIRLIVAIVLLIGLTVALGIALIAGVAITVPPGNYYPLAVGNKWTYQMSPGNSRYDVTIPQQMTIDNKTAFAVVVDESYSYMGKIGGAVYEFGQGEPGAPQNAAFFDPPHLTYPAQFVIGSTWDSEVPSEALVKGSDTVDVSGSVDQQQDVRVPAGIFKDCVKVTVDDPRDAPSDQTEIWFARNVGIVKTVTYTVIGNRPPTTSMTELVQYHVLRTSK